MPKTRETASPNARAADPGRLPPKHGATFPRTAKRREPPGPGHPATVDQPSIGETRGGRSSRETGGVERAGGPSSRIRRPSSGRSRARGSPGAAARVGTSRRGRAGDVARAGRGTNARARAGPAGPRGARRAGSAPRRRRRRGWAGRGRDTPSPARGGAPRGPRSPAAGRPDRTAADLQTRASHDERHLAEEVERRRCPIRIRPHGPCQSRPRGVGSGEWGVGSRQ